jgi:hypothetical protein
MSSAPTKTNQASLPQLSGRLLWCYRIIWCALAVGALAASVLSAFHFAFHPAILGVRLVKSTVLVSVATILLCRRQRDPVAALLALAFLAWTITSSFGLGTDSGLAQLLDRGRFLLFALALLLFPDGRWQPVWGRWVARASVAVFLIGVSEGLHLLPTQVFLPLAASCVLAAVVTLGVRFRRTSDYELKQQLKWIALGLTAGVFLILFARAGAAESILPIGVMPILWETMFQIGIIIVALGFLVSLLRYRLFDAETVISRSVAYAALTIALVATFGGTEAVIENLGQLYLGMNVGSVSGAMAAAVAAVMLNPLHTRMSDWAEQRFQPDLALLKREMPELLGRLAATASTRKLSTAVLPRINAAIHASRSALIINGRVTGACGLAIGDCESWWDDAIREQDPLLERHHGDRLFPVRLRLSTDLSSSTWLLLGPRPDMTLYGREDLDAVRSTFPAFKQALTAAMLREALGAATARRESRVRKELSEIRTRLQKIEITREGL